MLKFAMKQPRVSVVPNPTEDSFRDPVNPAWNDIVPPNVFSVPLAYYPHYVGSLRQQDKHQNIYYTDFKLPSAMNGTIDDSGNEFGTVSISPSSHVLELRNVSYIRSFTSGKWWSKLFNPPITAQFLKDVSLTCHGGEIMGVVGSSGAGKTTLLNVIARRVQGTTGGNLLLNHRLLVEKQFQDQCAYVSFKQFLLPELTIRETLIYQAELGLSSKISAAERKERVNLILADFDLESIKRVRVRRLSESVRRRLLLAVHCVRDPGSFI